MYNCFKLLLLLDKTTLKKKNFVYICIFICLIFVAKHKKETKKYGCGVQFWKDKVDDKMDFF